MGRSGLCKQYAGEACGRHPGGGGADHPREPKEQLLQFPAGAEPRAAHQRGLQEELQGGVHDLPLLRQRGGAEEALHQEVNGGLVRYVQCCHQQSKDQPLLPGWQEAEERA